MSCVTHPTAGRFRGILLRSAVAVGALLMFALATGSAAMAHTEEVSADPPADSLVIDMPAQVILTFDEPLLDAGAALVVTSAAGTVVSEDPPIIDGPTIRVNLGAGQPGRYQVAYRVVSGDGHPVTGSYAFEVADTAPSSSSAPSAVDPPPSSPPSSSPTSSASPPIGSNNAVNAESQAGSGSVPVLASLAAALAVVATITVVLLLRRRRA